jgi:hypothetical protein
VPAGYQPRMTASHHPFVPDDERAQSVGATGGLPGANADPRTAEVAPEEIESTVAGGDMPGDAAPDPFDELRDDDALTDEDALTDDGARRPSR